MNYLDTWGTIAYNVSNWDWQGIVQIQAPLESVVAIDLLILK